VTRRRDGGFTLLEVMVSLAILAVALVVLVEIVTNNVRATNKAKLMTAATFLARAKIVEIEDRVLTQGFGQADENDAGDFSNEGYPRFAWTSLVERVELPADLAVQAQQAATDQSMQAQATQNPLQAMSGFLGGFMTTLIEPIKIGLQESVRKVTVKVTWDEVGRGPQTLEVATFMTDPVKLDMAVPGLGGTGTPGTGGSSGTGAGGTSGSRPGTSPTTPPATGGTRR
jgi:general secretion pathway protein I